MRIPFWTAAFILLLSPHRAFAAPAKAPGNPMALSESTLGPMADSMKRMADMCETMMKKEMAMMPVKMTASAVLGVLVVVALVLFIILEVLWIKHWRHRLRAEGSVPKGQ